MTDLATTRHSGWIPNDATFGARLALVRQRMSWGNVKEAADACGLPVESWRRWERDGRAPRNVVEVSALIAERTGVDLGWLIAGNRLMGRGTELLSSSRIRPYTRPARRPMTPQPTGHPITPTGPRRPQPLSYAA